MKKIIPEACLGIMGGGQLARMLAIAAKQMGYKIAILTPEANCPAQSFADHHIISPYTNKEALTELAKLSAVVTTEFENVPARSMKYLEQKTTVCPSYSAIAITQNRIAEKAFFNACAIKTTQYVAIVTAKDIASVGLYMFPAILKTNAMGYDGKGQIKVNNLTELELAWRQLECVPAILEKLVILSTEVSIMVARSHNEILCYPVVENVHINGILDTTIIPAQIDAETTKYIEQAAKTIIHQLDYIGILGIEFFITKDGILANEMAPRPHNTGHYTIDACITSQFEQHIRAICNLKLGDTRLLTNAIMLNLLGNIWPTNINQNPHPAWDKILDRYANVKLHLYNKTPAIDGRKMGHLTILGDNTAELYKQLSEIKSLLNFNTMAT